MRVPAQDELTGPSRSRAVPPEHAAIALVDRDDAWNGDGTSLGIGEHSGRERRVDRRIRADDGARARGAVERHAVVAGVARVPRHVFRIAVRRHQLGEPGPIEHRARLRAVDNRHVVDLDAAPGMDAEVDPPAIPQNLAAAEAEARTIRLRHDERPQWAALGRSGPLRRVTGHAIGCRVEDLFDRSSREIDADIESAHLHVVADAVPGEGGHDNRNGRSTPGKPGALAKAAQERDAIEILDAASGERLHHAPIGERDLGRAIDHDPAQGWISHGDGRRGADRATLQIDGLLGGDAGAPVVQHSTADAGLGALSLVRLGELDRHDPDRRGHPARLRQDVGDEGDLRGRERVEPVHRTRRRLRAQRGLTEEHEGGEQQAEGFHGMVTAVCCDGRAHRWSAQPGDSLSER